MIFSLFSLIFKPIFATENFPVACGGVFTDWEFYQRSQEGAGQSLQCCADNRSGAGFQTAKSSYRGKGGHFLRSKERIKATLLSPKMGQKPSPSGDSFRFTIIKVGLCTNFV